VFDGLSLLTTHDMLRSTMQPFGRSTAGASVAVGDVTNDGRGDLVVGMASGGSTVKVFSGMDYRLVRTFSAFPPSYRGGVGQVGFSRVALGGVTLVVGDVYGTGVNNVIAGAGPGSKPGVAIFHGVTFRRARLYLARPIASKAGVIVSVVPLDGGNPGLLEQVLIKTTPGSR
jgi:hypothetical protein